jgi:phosphopantetheinyl transferase
MAMLRAQGSGGWAKAALPTGEIVLWHIPLRDQAIRKAGLPRLMAMLSSDERARAGRLRFEEHRHRFVAAHAAMRWVLSSLMGVTPEAVLLQVDEGGKPGLMEEGPHFNLSHSGDHAVLAICATSPVGVDCEVLRPMPNCMELADRFFAIEERSLLAGHAVPDRESWFFRIWTAKEALLKGTGDGLRLPLAAFAVVPDESDGAPVGSLRLGRVDAAAGRLAGWRLVFNARLGPLQVAVASPLNGVIVRQQQIAWPELLAFH